MKKKDKTPDPESQRLKNKKYMKELRKLQAELCHLQEWVKHKGLRVIIIFEGRDAAGKGGTIRAMTERVSPRVFRTVALPAPSDREKSQMYMQRYMAHFPAAGEVVIFDRSWYNRLGVEYVMGFCSKEQHARFLELCPELEKYIVEGGIKLIKIWLDSSDKEQKRRFEARIDESAPPVETQPDGPAVALEVVRVFARPRHDARGHRHQIRALVRPAFRRQETRASQLPPSHPRAHPVQESSA